MKNKIMTLLKNGGLFLLLLALTGYIVLKDYSLSELMETVSSVKLPWLGLGVTAMGIFLLCEGMNIARCLHLFGCERITLRHGIKYALVGFFFSSVTPSASGGQPMQLYFMHWDGVKLSHGSLALLFELLSFQTVTIGLAIAGYFYRKQVILDAMGNLRYLLLLGILLNTVVMALLVCTIFFHKTLEKPVAAVLKLITLFSRDKAQALERKLAEQLQEYQKAAVYLRQNRAIFAKTLATTFLQILAMDAVPYFVYKGFGLDVYTVTEIMALQAVLYVAVSALPLPGALGVSESGFMMLFRTLFPTAVLPGAMMISRSISFYLFVLISGIAVAIFWISGKKIRRRGVVTCRTLLAICRRVNVEVYK